MKRSELEEIIKTALLEEYQDEDYDNMENLGEAKKDEEEEEVEDVEVDEEEEITLDEPEEEEMEMEPESDTSGLDAGEKGLQNNLEKALVAAKEMGDQKLADQIGNTITFFTRTHVVGDAGSVEEVELNEENVGLADLEEMGYEAGVEAFDMASNSMDFQNTPDFKSYKKGFFQGFTDESSAQGLAEEKKEVELNEGYTRMQKLAGLTK